MLPPSALAAVNRRRESLLGFERQINFYSHNSRLNRNYVYTIYSLFLRDRTELRLISLQEHKFSFFLA